MSRNRSFHLSFRWFTVAVLMAGFAANTLWAHGDAASQVSGTTYTSPSYGYTISWQSPWYVVEDDADQSGYDVLRIADSQSEVLFLGGYLGRGNATAVLQQLVEQVEAVHEYTNLSPVENPLCSSGQAVTDTATACYRADTTDSNGSSEALGMYFKTWSFEGGVTLLLRAITAEPILLDYIPHWNNFTIAERQSASYIPTSGCSAETHHGVEFCFDSALSERDRSDVVEGVLLGASALAKIRGGPLEASIHVSGWKAVSPSGDGLIATTYGDAIAVYAGSSLWQDYAPIERIEALVHEYFHVFQNSMTDSVDPAVPLWFTEGSAESFGYTVASQIGVTTEEEFYSLALYSLNRRPVTKSLREVGSNGSIDANEYPLVYMAVQQLLADHGMSIAALVDVYQQLSRGSQFDDVFVSVFGTTLEEFYGAFESQRVEMPTVQSLEDDFYANGPDGEMSQDEFVWTTFPVGVDHGAQMVFVAQTAPLADCTLNLFLSGSSIQRDTWANGEGEIFWLVSLPDDASASVGFLYAKCGTLFHHSVTAVK